MRRRAPSTVQALALPYKPSMPVWCCRAVLRASELDSLPSSALCRQVCLAAHLPFSAKLANLAMASCTVLSPWCQRCLTSLCTLPLSEGLLQ